MGFGATMTNSFDSEIILHLVQSLWMLPQMTPKTRIFEMLKTA
ncbi:hypothetical protein GRFL_1799 [Christiangramia flava JLT2011]|uniref:Uncharacterized protein n=1 Tax=Christiangramia flava JLT2011 TaxID=1229726 RepID=A0A1L7I5S1_9FLAO|nr:hypothetical protein GRFL_1799 [Christiangramia flava JLT2011]